MIRAGILKPGISLVELVGAVALLSVVSLAAVQLMNMTERTMVGSQTKLNNQLRSEAIASYIYKDFARGTLDDTVVSRTYVNGDMPEDLRGAGDVTGWRSTGTRTATGPGSAFPMRHRDVIRRASIRYVAIMSSLKNRRARIR